MATTASAGSRVAQIPELLENILLNLAPRHTQPYDLNLTREDFDALGPWPGHFWREHYTLFTCQSTSKAFRDTIQGSKKLQRHMYLLPPTADDNLPPFSHTNMVVIPHPEGESRRSIRSANPNFYRSRYEQTFGYTSKSNPFLFHDYNASVRLSSEKSARSQRAFRCQRGYIQGSDEKLALVIQCSRNFEYDAALTAHASWRSLYLGERGTKVSAIGVYVNEAQVSDRYMDLEEDLVDPTLGEIFDLMCAKWGSKWQVIEGSLEDVWALDSSEEGRRSQK